MMIGVSICCNYSFACALKSLILISSFLNFDLASFDHYIIGDAVDLINGTEWRKTAFPHFRNQFGLFGGIKGLDYKKSAGTRVGSTALVFMVRWFLAQHIKKDPTILQQYERFVVSDLIES